MRNDLPSADELADESDRLFILVRDESTFTRNILITIDELDRIELRASLPALETIGALAQAQHLMQHATVPRPRKNEREEHDEESHEDESRNESTNDAVRSVIELISRSTERMRT